MHIPAGSHRLLKRYLTPIYSFTLGLALILALAACDRQAGETPDQDTFTQTVRTAQATSPASIGTQAHTKSSPTPLPAIPATPNISTPSPLGVTAEQLNGVQITLWYPWRGVEGVLFQTILDEFNRTNKYGITVTATAYESFGSLDDAVEAALGSAPLPDVLVDYGSMARQWDASGIMADLSLYVDDPVWGFSNDEQADFISSFWSEDLDIVPIRSQVRRLGLPYYRAAYALFYNETWAEQLGYPAPPATPEDFRVRACAAAEAVTKAGDKTNLGKGGWLVTPEPGALVGWIYAFGSDITSPGVAGYRFNTPETGQAFTFVKNLQESGCGWADLQADPRAEFAGRRALFVAGSLFDIPAQREAMSKVNSADQWMVIPFPSSAHPVVDTYGPSLLMTRSTPEKQLAAWLVMEWLVYPPNQAEFVQQLGVYPTRQITLSYLGDASGSSPQWAQALGLIPDAHAEPMQASWNTMRWVLADAANQLFSQQFGADQVPSLLEKLDSLAEEITSQVP